VVWDVVADRLVSPIPGVSKAELLLTKMKTNRDITWNEKGELKYKDKIVHGSNIVDLVNDVLRKKNKYIYMDWS
jgi:hypothetical protein